jgi:hypothetical protein
MEGDVERLTWTRAELERHDEQVRALAIAAFEEAQRTDGRRLTVEFADHQEPIRQAIENGQLTAMYRAWRAVEVAEADRLATDATPDVPPTQVDPDVIGDGVQALVVGVLEGWSDHKEDHRTPPAPLLRGALDRLHGAAIVLGWVAP